MPTPAADPFAVPTSPFPLHAYPRIPTAVTRAESDLLAELTADRRVLEIGSWYGYSTVWMAMNGAEVLAIDPQVDRDAALAFNANLLRYQVAGHVFVVEAPVAEVADQLHPVFDAAFIDGDHAYASALHDIRLARRVVRPGGWVIVHDFTFPSPYGGGWPGVVQAVQEGLRDLREVRRVGCIYAARLRPDAARQSSES